MVFQWEDSYGTTADRGNHSGELCELGSRARYAACDDTVGACRSASVNSGCTTAYQHASTTALHDDWSAHADYYGSGWAEHTKRATCANYDNYATNRNNHPADRDNDNTANPWNAWSDAACVAATRAYSGRTYLRRCAIFGRIGYNPRFHHEPEFDESEQFLGFNDYNPSVPEWFDAAHSGADANRRRVPSGNNARGERSAASDVMR